MRCGNRVAQRNIPAAQGLEDYWPEARALDERRVAARRWRAPGAN
jgi:hypothetical protein